MKIHAYEPVISQIDSTECVRQNQDIQIGAFVVAKYDFVIKTSTKEDNKIKRLFAIVKDVKDDKSLM